MERAENALRNTPEPLPALPELIAVVEAAERIDASPAAKRHGFLPLNNALEALEEKLS